MKSVYYVVLEGINIQGIYGIFDDNDLAFKAAKEAKNREKDDYHSVYVYEKILNNKSYENISEKVIFEGDL